MQVWEVDSAVNISIHAPTRGATHPLFTLEKTPHEFQSTLPREERQSLRDAENRKNTFQSTLPREERHGIAARCLSASHFNPRSHERSDEIPVSRKFYPADISIHAPTRGATLTSPQGRRYSYFNPRSHERSDVLVATY